MHLLSQQMLRALPYGRFATRLPQAFQDGEDDDHDRRSAAALLEEVQRARSWKNRKKCIFRNWQEIGKKLLISQHTHQDLQGLHSFTALLTKFFLCYVSKKKS